MTLIIPQKSVPSPSCSGSFLPADLRRSACSSQEGRAITRHLAISFIRSSGVQGRGRPSGPAGPGISNSIVAWIFPLVVANGLQRLFDRVSPLPNSTFLSSRVLSLT